MSPESAAGTIQFHPEQVKWLNKMFPEVVHSADSTPAEMYVQAGIRRVIKVIESKQR